MRKLSVLGLCGLVGFSIVVGWGLGAVIAAFGFAGLYGPKAAAWLDR